MIYTLPLSVAWPYFPENKGAVSGFIMCGFSVGGIFFANFSKHFVNPENLPPDYVLKVGSVKEKLYSPTSIVTSRVPSLLKTLGVILLAISAVAIFLSQPIKIEKEVSF